MQKEAKRMQGGREGKERKEEKEGGRDKGGRKEGGKEGEKDIYHGFHPLLSFLGQKDIFNHSS